MAKKAYADIDRFKKVEAAVRAAAQAHRAAVAEIDTALAGKRSDADRALLKAAKADCERLYAETRGILHRLFEALT